MVEIFKTISTVIFMFLAPIYMSILVVVGFLVFDTILAIYVKHTQALKTGKKSPITSRKFGMILIKIILYISAILLGFGLDTVLINVLLLTGLGIKYLFTKIIMLFIITQEVISIDESIRVANNNNGIKFYFNYIFATAKLLKCKIFELIKRDQK